MRIINCKLGQGYAFSMCGIVPAKLGCWRVNTYKMMLDLMK